MTAAIHFDIMSTVLSEVAQFHLAASRGAMISMNITEYIERIQNNDLDAIADLPFVLERGTFLANNGQRLDDAMYQPVFCDDAHLDVLPDASAQQVLINWMSEKILQAPPGESITPLFAMGKSIASCAAPALRNLVAECAIKWTDDERYQALIAFENILDNSIVQQSFCADDVLKHLLTESFRTSERNTEVTVRILIKITDTTS